MKKMTDNDFELFICRNEKKSERRELLKRALLAYGIKKEELSRAALCRTDLGKPYFEGLENIFQYKPQSRYLGLPDRPGLLRAGCAVC